MKWISNEIPLYSTRKYYNQLLFSMMEDNMIKRMYICVCDWVTLLYSRNLTEYCKPTIMEEITSLNKF